jgi:hypothetical protein
MSNERSAPDVLEMRKAIAAITGRLPVSYNRRYLSIRLAELRRGVKVPDRVRRPARSHSSSVSVSMTDDRRDLIAAMAERASMNISQLVARAIDEYAVRHGFGDEVQRIARRSAS